MHEFTLARNIIEIVAETAEKNHADRVSEVLLEIGALSGVEIQALDMALECLRSGTIIQETEIKKDIIEAVAVCNRCGCEYRPTDYLSICPECKTSDVKIIRGKELRVKSITTE